MRGGGGSVGRGGVRRGGIGRGGIGIGGVGRNGIGRGGRGGVGIGGVRKDSVGRDSVGRGGRGGGGSGRSHIHSSADDFSGNMFLPEESPKTGSVSVHATKNQLSEPDYVYKLGVYEKKVQLL